MKIHGFLLGLAELLLIEVLNFSGAADTTVSRFFRQHPKLGNYERGVIAEAIFAVLRRKMEFSHLAESGSGKTSRRLILLGFMQTLGRAAMAKFISQNEQDWLEHVSKISPSTLPVRIQSNLPDWIFEALNQRFDTAEMVQLTTALNLIAPLDCRVNTFKASRSQVIESLIEAGIEAQTTPFAPNGIRINKKPVLNALSVFKEGLFEIQDEGSQLICHLLAPARGEMVVDFCAGAGGKTLALGAMMRSTGRLYAFDIAQRRLAKFKPRLARSGLSNVFPIVIDSEHDSKIRRLAGKIDRVLVDAPCSGLGTLRRNPDLKWRQKPESVKELAIKQHSILNSAANLLKPKGRIVYATCSLLAEENENIVQTFLENHENFKKIPANEILAKQEILIDTGENLWLLPHQHGTDGFFAVALEKQG